MIINTIFIPQNVTHCPLKQTNSVANNVDILWLFTKVLMDQGGKVLWFHTAMQVSGEVSQAK